jgi:hypothetical protein
MVATLCCHNVDQAALPATIATDAGISSPLRITNVYEWRRDCASDVGQDLGQTIPRRCVRPSGLRPYDPPHCLTSDLCARSAGSVPGDHFRDGSVYRLERDEPTVDAAPESRTVERVGQRRLYERQSYFDPALGCSEGALEISPLARTC